MSQVVEIFSDGACSGNPGPGGWGAILRFGSTVKELSGGEQSTTNNRMELLGAIAALESLVRPCKVVVTSDSQYLVKGMNEWLAGWVRKGWRTTQGPVVNQDLWERLLALSQKHSIEWCWVRGHNGHPENERCDELARAALEALKVGSAVEDEPGGGEMGSPVEGAAAEASTDKGVRARVEQMVESLAGETPINQIRSLMETLGGDAEHTYHVVCAINEILNGIEGAAKAVLAGGGAADTEQIMAWLENDPRDAMEAFPDPESPERRIAYRVEWLLREAR